MKRNILQDKREQRYVRQNGRMQEMQERRDTVKHIFREVSQNKKRGLE